MKNKFFLYCTLSFLIINISPSFTQNIPDFLVNQQGSVDGAQQANPSMAGDGNGHYVLTWEDKRNGSDFDIFAQICESDGSFIG